MKKNLYGVAVVLVAAGIFYYIVYRENHKPLPPGRDLVQIDCSAVIHTSDKALTSVEIRNHSELNVQGLIIGIKAYDEDNNLVQELKRTIDKKIPGHMSIIELIDLTESAQKCSCYMISMN